MIETQTTTDQFDEEPGRMGARKCGGPVGAFLSLALLAVVVWVLAGCGVRADSAYVSMAPPVSLIEPPIPVTTLRPTTTTLPPTTTTEPAPPPAVRGLPEQLTETLPAPTTTVQVFAMGECGWVADELARRGLRQDWIDWSVRIAHRESQCCPNVRGGDRTDSNCNVTHVAAWHHRSDTGVFQLNGVNYRGPGTLLCDAGIACDQDTLLNNIDLQFDGFLLLLSKCGKGPWTKPYWCKHPGPIFN